MILFFLGSVFGLVGSILIRGLAIARAYEQTRNGSREPNGCPCCGFGSKWDDQDLKRLR